jgi:hypothetical protein
MRSRRGVSTTTGGNAFPLVAATPELFDCANASRVSTQMPLTHNNAQHETLRQNLLFIPEAPNRDIANQRDIRRSQYALCKSGKLLHYG